MAKKEDVNNETFGLYFGKNNEDRTLKFSFHDYMCNTYNGIAELYGKSV